MPDPGRHIIVLGYILDRELVADLLRRYRIDTIVHFAAETHVDRSILDLGLFIETNVTGTFTLLEWYLNHPDWVDAISKQPDYQQWMKNNYAMRGKQ